MCLKSGLSMIFKRAGALENSKTFGTVSKLAPEDRSVSPVEFCGVRLGQVLKVIINI